MQKCGKEGHVARKCLSKPQNVNALDDSASDLQETYHLFTLDTHSVRSVSAQSFSQPSNYQQQNFFYAWKTLQLDSASTTNTFAVDDHRTMFPAGFDIHGLIKPSTAILRTYGGGVIKPVGQVELACEAHISMNPNVTPIQAHPHRCPVANEAKASHAIRDVERQGITKKVTEPTAWISNSVYREMLSAVC